MNLFKEDVAVLASGVSGSFNLYQGDWGGGRGLFQCSATDMPDGAKVEFWYNPNDGQQWLLLTLDESNKGGLNFLFDLPPGQFNIYSAGAIEGVSVILHRW